MDALKEMRRRDIGEIERRVLPQQYDVEFGKVRAPGRAEAAMIVRLVADLKRLDRREELVAVERQPVRRVIDNRMASRLRFQKQRKCRIAADVDPLDRIHLYGNLERHRSLRASK